MKYTELKHGFTNRGCLNCDILKALHGFQEKSSQVKNYEIFFFKMFQMRFLRYSNCLKTT